VTFCNPEAGYEKGNVENKVGYVRRNMFVPVPTVVDVCVFNRIDTRQLDIAPAF